MATLEDIFEIPEAVHQGDFVLRLTQGLSADQRAETLRQYIVTPQLVTCFDQALSLVGSAVNANSSKGAYLHGSFGSGKSHFMAVLDMLLEGDPAARSIAKLAQVVAKNNRWWEGRKFLLVPFHMIGATSMESAVLGGYARYIRERHPGAPTPGFYRSQALIKNANLLREKMGDEKFFDALRGEAGGGGWGAIGGGWDKDGFEAAVAAPPDDAEHQRLVGDLIDAYFSGVRESPSDEGYIDLDRGLAVMSRHAKSLGYNAVVLFLDELVLWLASHSADQIFLNTEGQKVAKLVEAGDAARPIPIVSFIARQRDLRELIGDSIPGAQQLTFADVLQWWEARFDKITLEDRNLPEIIEGRLLHVKGPAERQQLREAFEKTARVRQEVLDILLTREGDRAMFEKVYPFSPALVQTVIAISSMLQRERTALKLMLQLLVRNRRLPLGDVIPVGDLFDVIIEGDEPFTQAIKHLFDRARELWMRKFVPLLQESHDVLDTDVAAGRADPVVIKRYRADAGLLKTLLLSELASKVESLGNLTPVRLAALNHGTIRSPLPNAEHQSVLLKMREWSSRVGEIHISHDALNPLISLQLAGVDIEGVLENARNNDNLGNRIRTVKEMIFGDFGLEENGDGLLPPAYQWLWRGTARSAELLARNVRELSAESFRPGGEAWRVVIDFPFDEEGHSPADDRAVVQRYREENASTRTIVWLPSFLNEKALADLGRLVVLNHVLSGNRLEEYGSHLQPAERAEARTILRNQRDQLKGRMHLALEQAYGISQAAPSAFDTTHELDQHFESLHAGLRLQPPPGGGFKESLEHLLDQALTFQFPAHPIFAAEVRKTGLKKAWAVIELAVDSPDGRTGMDRAIRDEVRRIVEPLRLAQCGEGHLHLSDHWRNHFERKLAEHRVHSPTVSQLRSWMDQPQVMGLSEAVGDLVILTWAAQAGRSFYLHNAPVTPDIGALTREFELRTQALPPESEWRIAVDRASSLFGLAPSAARNASNVATLTTELKNKAAELAEPVRRYAAALTPRLKSFGVRTDCNRAETALAAGRLIDAIHASERNDAVSILAAAQVATSEAAMGTASTKARDLEDALQSPQWEVLDALRRKQGVHGAQGVLSAMASALGEDEHVTALAHQLREQHRRALQLLTETPLSPPAPPAPPAEPTLTNVQVVVKRGLRVGEARQSFRHIEEALEKDLGLRVDLEYRLYQPDEPT
jgi:hypothetical protein